MDSLTQLALGAAVTTAVMHRRTAAWKAAAWGALAGTLPDLDVFIDHGDPVLNMVLHRAETHALFWLTLFSLPLALVVARLQRETPLWRRWWLALWLALVTHPLLDTMTVYGTQLALPFSNHPFGVASVFIIDPLVTLPWLAGAAWVVASRGSVAGHRANLLGLALGCAYLGWSVAAQQHVQRLALQSLSAQGITPQRLLVTPAPLNTVLWRVVVIAGDRHLEGFHSLLDAPGPMRFDAFDRGAKLDAEIADNALARRIRDFSHGLYKVHAVGDRLLITDLRMGQEPHYAFSFAVARRASAPEPLPVAQAMGSRAELGPAWAWLWRRALGQPLAPPR